MKTKSSISLILAVMVGLMMNQSTNAELKVGDQAPDFSLQGSDGKTYQLADFRDQQAVVLAWFPKAFTGG